MSFETNIQKLLQIALFGQNDLATKIDRQLELKDRITIFGALTPLTYDDLVALIDFRWKVAGGEKHPFAPDALEAIFKYSKGLLRKISKLCDNALIRTLSNELKSINNQIIEQVAHEVRLSEKFEHPKPVRHIRKKYQEGGEVISNSQKPKGAFAKLMSSTISPPLPAAANENTQSNDRHTPYGIVTL